MEPKKINGKWGFDFSYKNKRYRQQGFATKKEAKMVIEKILENPMKQQNKYAHLNFAQYFTLWVETYKEKYVTHKTYLRYFNALRKFLLYFGDNVRPNDVTQREYQEYMNQLGEQYTLGTMKKDHQAIRACYEQAVYDGIAKRNPTFNARLESEIEDMPEHVKFMEDFEYEKLKEVLKNMDSVGGLFLYILHVTGARFGEVNNLRYEDFDFENETIFIRGGKTVNAKRTVELSHADSQHIQSQIERLRINLNGTFLKRSNTAVKSHFKYALDKAGIKGHKILHSLRHTHITYLIDKGVDDEHVSKRVGHANINITREFYGHRFNSSKEQSESVVKDILNSIENNDTL